MTPKPNFTQYILLIILTIMKKKAAGTVCYTQSPRLPVDVEKCIVSPVVCGSITTLNGWEVRRVNHFYRSFHYIIHDEIKTNKQTTTIEGERFSLHGL